jgi:hypothetical protein
LSVHEETELSVLKTNYKRVQRLVGNGTLPPTDLLDAREAFLVKEIDLKEISKARFSHEVESAIACNDSIALWKITKKLRSKVKSVSQMTTARFVEFFSKVKYSTNEPVSLLPLGVV